MAIWLIDKIKPKNGGKFPLMDAEDVLLPDGTRLSDVDLSKGRDGLTPYVGNNGNWWIGDTDTGVKAQGEKGARGIPGYTPVRGVDYFTEEDTYAIKSYIDSLFVPLTQEEYDALETVDPDKYYMIVGDGT